MVLFSKTKASKLSTLVTPLLLLIVMSINNLLTLFNLKKQFDFKFKKLEHLQKVYYKNYLARLNKTKLKLINKFMEANNKDNHAPSKFSVSDTKLIRQHQQSSKHGGGGGQYANRR